MHMCVLLSLIPSWQAVNTMSLLAGLVHPMYKLYGTKQEELEDPLVERMSGFTAREKSLCFMDTENRPERGQLEDLPPGNSYMVCYI